MSNCEPSKKIDRNEVRQLVGENNFDDNIFTELAALNDGTYITGKQMVAKINDMKIVPSSGEFSNSGITLQGMREFVARCGGVIEFAGLTTTDVCNYFLLPLTSARRESYCKLLSAEGSENVGSATVFISHAWKFLFLDVLCTLENHFYDTPNVLLYFDLFSNNQHEAVSFDLRGGAQPSCQLLIILGML